MPIVETNIDDLFPLRVFLWCSSYKDSHFQELLERFYSTQALKIMYNKTYYRSVSIYIFME